MGRVRSASDWSRRGKRIISSGLMMMTVADRGQILLNLVISWGAGYGDTYASREGACDSHTPHRAPLARPMFVLWSAGWRALPDQGWPGNSIDRLDAQCPHNTDTGGRAIPPL